MNQQTRVSIITAIMTNVVEVRKITDIVIHDQTVEFKLRGVAYIAEGEYPKIRVRFRDDYQWAPEIEKQVNHISPVRGTTGRTLIKRPAPKSLQSLIQPKTIRRS